MKETKDMVTLLKEARAYVQDRYDELRDTTGDPILMIGIRKAEIEAANLLRDIDKCLDEQVQ